MKVRWRKFSEALNHTGKELLFRATGLLYVLGTDNLLAGPLSLSLGLLSTRELDLWLILTLLQKGAPWYLFLCDLTPGFLFSRVVCIIPSPHEYLVVELSITTFKNEWQDDLCKVPSRSVGRSSPHSAPCLLD